MALSAKEKQLIDALVESHLRLEQLIVGQISPLAGLGLRVRNADPLNSPLIFSEAEKKQLLRTTGAASRKAGSAKKRKVSAYQKAFGVELKKLKKKHPRTNISVLMKKAHRATKKKRK